eukprot:363616-Chlamydomonas_euryale.AAC.4
MREAGAPAVGKMGPSATLLRSVLGVNVDMCGRSTAGSCLVWHICAQSAYDNCVQIVYALLVRQEVGRE